MARPVANYRDVPPLFRPRSIAIVGASERPDSWSARIFRNLKAYGFPGDLFLVNPRHRELYGAPCFSSVAEIPGAVDQLVIIVPATQVPGILEEGGRRGCRSAVIFSGGFSETNTPSGREAERRMVAAAERHGILICGPNCLGNVSTRERVLTLAEQGVDLFGAGGLAIVSQSSGLMGGVARLAHARGIGLSYGIASGSEANVDAADYLNFLVEDPSTELIALILETVRRPVLFARACERARALRKPVLALKIGRSREGKAAAFSHTGALAGSYEAFVAFCRRHGVVEIKGLDEFVESAELFLRSPKPAAEGVAAIALSGGARGYLCDLGEELGINFPRPSPQARGNLSQLLGVGAGVGNPLDLGAGGAADPGIALKCMECFAGEPEVGLIAFQGELPRGPEFAARAQGFKNMIERARGLGKPLVFFSCASYPVTEYGTSFRDFSGAPFLQEIRKAFTAIARFMDYHRGAASGRVVVRSRREEARSKNALPDGEAIDLIKRAGFSVPRFQVCASMEEALLAAREIGYPIALKISAPGLTHKSELKGVRLGLSGAGEVERAAAALIESALASGVSCQFLVQEMVPGRLELFLGWRQDPEFGPLILFGLGGMFVEAGARIVARLAPLGEAEAEEMLLESGVERALSRLGLDSSAGRAPVVEAIIRMSKLSLQERALETIEINPLILRDNACVAVDVVALVREKNTSALLMEDDR